ncbi:MAG TPA: hypothetical protein VGF28_23890 [Thermoanaerobaculia bacterium]|jgi:hypothetical protein
MNKRIVTLTLLVSLAVAANAFAAIEGAWTATPSERDKGELHLNLTYRPHSNHGMSMDLAGFTGLTAAQINATATTPVNFQLRREAGTAVFEGTFRNGKGAGQFTFTGNPGYLQSMRALGIEVGKGGRKHRRDHTEEENLLSYALFDVSTAYVKSMIAEGYRVSLEEYMEMRIFDVTPEYIREMRSLGYKDIDTDELVSTKIHRVTPDYIRRMRAAGWGDLSLDDLTSSSIHKATPEFAEEMKQLGYGDLDMDDLVSFRIHKVTADFIRELRQLGYDKVDADDLVSMRIHRVTPEFIREIKAAGYSRVPVEKLISMRIAGVDASYLKKMNGDG